MQPAGDASTRCGLRPDATNWKDAGDHRVVVQDGPQLSLNVGNRRLGGRKDLAVHVHDGMLERESVSIITK